MVEYSCELYTLDNIGIEESQNSEMRYHKELFVMEKQFKWLCNQNTPEG